MVYTGGEGDTRFFSRVPKSPTLAALWRRRRQRKKPTTPSIKATPRMPPTTPPTTAPVLLPPEAVGLLSGTVPMGDCPVSMGGAAEVVSADWLDVAILGGVVMGGVVMSEVVVNGVILDGGVPKFTTVGLGPAVGVFWKWVSSSLFEHGISPP